MNMRRGRFNPPTAEKLKRKQEGNVVGPMGSKQQPNFPKRKPVIKPAVLFMQEPSGARARRSAARSAFGLNEGTAGQLKFTGKPLP